MGLVDHIEDDLRAGDAGKRRAALERLSRRARFERSSQRYVEILVREAEQHPADPFAARYLFEGLMHAGRFAEAEERAAGILTAACGETGTGCTETERRLLTVATLHRKAEAIEERLVRDRHPKAAVLAAMQPLLKEAIRVADEIEGTYSVPPVLEDWQDLDVRLRSRGVYLSWLRAAGLRESYVEACVQWLQSCPNYESPAVCHRAWSGEMDLLRHSGLDWNWECVVPTGPGNFDEAAWRSAGREERGRMVFDLIFSRRLYGKTRTEIVEVLGEPTREDGNWIDYDVDLGSARNEERRVVVLVPSWPETKSDRLRITLDRETGRAVGLHVDEAGAPI